MSDLTGKLLVGRVGTVTIGGSVIKTALSFEAKLTGKFSEVELLGEFITRQVFTGASGEGTLTLSKIDSTFEKMILECFETGVFPDIKLFGTLENKSTKKKETVMLSGVIFKEISLSKFDKDGGVSEELPFFFENAELVEGIFY